jgi:hypothetical protein
MTFEARPGAYECRRVAAQLDRDGHPFSTGNDFYYVEVTGMPLLPGADS